MKFSTQYKLCGIALNVNGNETSEYTSEAHTLSNCLLAVLCL